MKARFLWKDGYVDFRSVPKPLMSYIQRYEFDRSDRNINTRYKRLQALLEDGSLEDWTVDIITFDLCGYSDGSFEYVERVPQQVRKAAR